MWTCPICRHKFVSRNCWHSCSNYDLEHHFNGREPNVRAIFDRFLDVIEKVGPVTVIPQKTRIAIQAKVRFAGCITRKKWLLANLWMTRRVDHSRLRRTEIYGPGSFGHQFRFDSPGEIDPRFRSFVKESYAVGMRKHLKSRRRIITAK